MDKQEHQGWMDRFQRKQAGFMSTMTTLTCASQNWHWKSSIGSCKNSAVQKQLLKTMVNLHRKQNFGWFYRPRPTQLFLLFSTSKHTAMRGGISQDVLLYTILIDYLWRKKHICVGVEKKRIQLMAINPGGVSHLRDPVSRFVSHYTQINTLKPNQHLYLSSERTACIEIRTFAFKKSTWQFSSLVNSELTLLHPWRLGQGHNSRKKMSNVAARTAIWQFFPA